MIAPSKSRTRYKFAALYYGRPDTRRVHHVVA